MRRLVSMAFITAMIALLAAGGWSILRSGPQVGPNVSADIDARRTAIEQRISDARHAGTLNGVHYFAALDEQHRFLIAQRKAEAKGMTAEARSQLLAELDRANANLDRILGK